MLNLYSPVLSFFLSLVMTMVFFLKKRIKNNETNVYSFLLIIALTQNVIGIIIITFAKIIQYEDILYFLNKIDYTLIYLYIVFLYVYIILHSVKKKKRLKFLLTSASVLSISVLIVIVFSKNYIINSGNIYNTYGLASDYLVFVAIILGIQMLYYIIKGFIHEKNERKKFVPMLIFWILMIFNILIRLFIPEILMEPIIISFVNLIMYFTIENPDVKMIEQLNVAKNEAEKANMAKSDFLSSMSHEIRTPLNAIVGLSQDMIDQEDLPDKFKEDANDIVNASNTLLEIVGNIIDISKIESNKMESIELDYSIHEIVDSVVKLNRTRIGEKDLKLTVTYAKDLPYELHGDKYHLKQVINNLVSNAIKYTEKGHVKIHVKCINKQHNSLLIISVEDTGKGIKKENINRLFDKFDRLDVEKNTTIEGVGLGLAITKRLVNLLGGKINVQSSFGYGSLFVVNVNQSISKLNKPKNETIVAEEIEEKNLLKNKKILIVDDNTLNIKVAKRAIEPLEMIIDTCESGKEAIILNIKNKYDIILMDIMMPGMSGEETLEKLKESENFNIPVIALTADAISGSKKKYINKGFASYIAKPFTKEIIKIEIEKILRRK